MFMRPVKSRAVRADEGPRRARDQRHRPAGRDARRVHQDALRASWMPWAWSSRTRPTRSRWSASGPCRSRSCWSPWPGAPATPTRCPRWPAGWRGWTRALTEPDRADIGGPDRRPEVARAGQRLLDAVDPDCRARRSPARSVGDPARNPAAQLNGSTAERPRSTTRNCAAP